MIFKQQKTLPSTELEGGVGMQFTEGSGWSQALAMWWRPEPRRNTERLLRRNSWRGRTWLQLRWRQEMNILVKKQLELSIIGWKCRVCVGVYCLGRWIGSLLWEPSLWRLRRFASWGIMWSKLYLGEVLWVCACAHMCVCVCVHAHAYPSPSSRRGLWVSAVSTAGLSVTVGVSWLGVVTVLSPRGVWPEGCTWWEISTLCNLTSSPDSQLHFCKSCTLRLTCGGASPPGEISFCLSSQNVMISKWHQLCKMLNSLEWNDCCKYKESLLLV